MGDGFDFNKVFAALVFAAFAASQHATAYSFCNKTPYTVDAAFAASKSNGLLSNSYSIVYSAWHSVEPNECIYAPIIFQGGSPPMGELQYFAKTRKDSGAPPERQFKWYGPEKGIFGSKQPTICTFNTVSDDWPIQSQVDSATCAAAGGEHYPLSVVRLHGYDSLDYSTHIYNGSHSISE